MTGPGAAHRIPLPPVYSEDGRGIRRPSTSLTSAMCCRSMAIGVILCKLDRGPKVENEAFVSISHLRFDARLPVTRTITTYHKHRVKRLRRQPS